MKRSFAVLLSSVVLIGCATPPLPANVTVAPDPLDFGKVFVGETKAMSGTLSNATGNPIQVRASTLGPGTVFAAGANPPVLPQALANGARLNFPFTFTPPAVGGHQGTWHLTLDRRPYAIALSGEGVLLLSDGPFGITGNAGESTGLDFGDVIVGQTKELEIVIRNLDLNGTAFTFNAAPAVAPAGPFTVTQPAGAFVLKAPPNRSRVTIKVVFAPTAVGRFTGTLTWTDNTGVVRLKCHVSGNGIAAE